MNIDMIVLKHELQNKCQHAFSHNNSKIFLPSNKYPDKSIYVYGIINC